MTEQTQQGAAQPSETPARIELDDFIEAVSRGVLRALEAQAEVSGYALNLSDPNSQASTFIRGTFTVGIIYNPGDRTGPGSLPNILEGPR